MTERRPQIEDKEYLLYQPSLFIQWKRGKLHGKWFRQHRRLFDKHDLSNACGQHPQGIHFGEWFTAIAYGKKGYRVLVEKYIYENHPEKLAIIRKLIGKHGLKLLQKWQEKCHAQPPDLFVYRGKEYFFVEVKRGRDAIRDCQRDFFKRIRKSLRCRVVVVNLQSSAK